jgi:hypothetical protein
MTQSLVINFWPASKSIGHSLALRDHIVNVLGEDATIFDSRRFNHQTSSNSCEQLLHILASIDPAHIFFVGSPSSLNPNEREFEQLLRGLSGRSLTYWEPDGWGRGKPLTENHKRWITRADVLLHSGGIPKLHKFTSPQAIVRFTPDTYCHLTFAEQEKEPPTNDPQFDVAMIANNVTKSGVPIPGLTGLRGSLPRWRLARKAHREFGTDHFLLHGRNWPVRWSQGTIPFSEQANAIRSARLSISWEHYSHLVDYSSDRLAIALLAGRPHLTNSSLGQNFFTGEDLSHFTCGSPQEMINKAVELIQISPTKTHEMGMRNWEWTRERLSSRNFARFALAQSRTEVTPPNCEPWSHLSPQDNMKEIQACG